MRRYRGTSGPANWKSSARRVFTSGISLGSLNRSGYKHPLPGAAALESKVGTKSFGRFHAGLQPAGAILQAHELGQRREIGVLAPSQLAVMTSQHLRFQRQL